MGRGRRSITRVGDELSCSWTLTGVTLRADLLWDNLTIVPCGNTPELCQLLPKHELNNYDVIIVHVGVNDIDKHDGPTVAEKLADVTKRIAEAAPHAKILLSEVTPRQLNRDDQVVECNQLLPSAVHSDIVIIRHSNLRNDEWSFHDAGDDKHLAEDSIARFAGNLKAGFRRAIGASQTPPWKTGGGSQVKKGRGGQGHQGNKILNIIRRELSRALKDL